MCTCIHDSGVRALIVVLDVQLVHAVKYARHFDMYKCILSRRRRDVETFAHHKPGERSQHRQNSDSKVTFKMNNGKLCCVPLHFLGFH